MYKIISKYGVTTYISELAAVKGLDAVRASDPQAYILTVKDS